MIHQVLCFFHRKAPDFCCKAAEIASYLWRCKVLRHIKYLFTLIISQNASIWKLLQGCTYGHSFLLHHVHWIFHLKIISVDHWYIVVFPSFEEPSYSTNLAHYSYPGLDVLHLACLVLPDSKRLGPIADPNQFSHVVRGIQELLVCKTNEVVI